MKKSAKVLLLIGATIVEIISYLMCLLAFLMWPLVGVVVFLLVVAGTLLLLIPSRSTIEDRAAGLILGAVGSGFGVIMILPSRYYEGHDLGPQLTGLVLLSLGFALGGTAGAWVWPPVGRLLGGTGRP